MIHFNPRLVKGRTLSELRGYEMGKQKLEVFMRKCRQQTIAEWPRVGRMHGAIPPGRSGPIPAGMDVASENRLRSALALYV